MKTIFKDWILEIYLIIFLLFVGLNALIYKNVIDICYFLIAATIIVKYVINSFSDR